MNPKLTMAYIKDGANAVIKTPDEAITLPTNNTQRAHTWSDNFPANGAFVDINNQK